MSLSNEILTFLAEQPPDTLVRLTPADIALEVSRTRDVSVSAETTSKLLWSLEHTQRIALNRNNGRITGIAAVLRVGDLRVSRSPSGRISQAARQASRKVGIESVALKGVRTPHLDMYASARSQAENFQQGGSSEYFEITFRESPIAEEGLRLRTALLRLEEQYRDLATQYKLTLYEYEGVKERMRQNGSGKIAAEIMQRDLTLPD